MSTQYRFVATAPRGLADLLTRELSVLGASGVAESRGSVHFEGDLGVGYRACLWSRVASRVLLQLAEVQAGTADEFYRQARQVEWETHVPADGTLACDFSGTHPAITHSHFGALRLKDAIVDRLRDRSGTRPDIQLERPSVRLHAHAQGTRILLALDLAGEGLHRRGYRLEAGEAPLRENLAAGVLLRARWDEAAELGAPFLDPLCGSGTLVIEAAMIAARRAPALSREYFGFLGWLQHDAALWQRLRTEAQEQALPAPVSPMVGSDVQAAVLRAALGNATRAGVAQLVRFEQRALLAVRPSANDGATAVGLICTNPPYGERLGDVAAARSVHAELGEVLRTHFPGWDAAILTAAPQAAHELRLRSYRVHDLWNGAIPCRLLRIDLAAPGARDLLQAGADQAAVAVSASASTSTKATAAAAGAELPREVTAATAPAAAGGAAMFANRLDKNVRRLARWARDSGVSCYRLYDADMPEYAFAIDRYEQVAAAAGDAPTVHLYVQEYAAPDSIDPEAARRRRREALSVLPGTLSVPPERIHLRVRKPQRGSSQYQPRHGTTRHRTSAGGESPLAAQSRMLTVGEGGHRFRVNLDDYLDTGLFLDHRLTRALLAGQARGGRFLNLFCYTATASVYAAAGGARSTVSLDLSNRYLDWAEENFRLNGMDPAHHRLEQADCLAWLADAARQSMELFDLIFLDPPTFSNSKRMQGVLDIQRDHGRLIEQCTQLLTPGGTLVFSTNAQRFKLSREVAERWQVRDQSRSTLPMDFERNPRIHRCYEIRRSSTSA